MPYFTHLHVHTQFSILDGLSNVDKLVDQAKNQGMDALAMTDHGNMFGLKKFHNTAKKAGIKPILGCETYVARRGRNLRVKSEGDLSGNHLILLAKNEQGYKNLVKLVSFSWMEGFYGKPRIDWELLEKYHEGLIALSACIGGEVPQAVKNGDLEKASKAVERFKGLFGDDYYLELQRHRTSKLGGDTHVFDLQSQINPHLVDLAKKHDVKIVASNDVHFVKEEDAEAHDRLICLTTNADVNDPNRLHYTKQEWLKSGDEMAEVFSDLPEALANTKEVADKIEFYELNKDPVMPIFDIPESFGTEDQYREKYDEAALIEEFTEGRYNKLGGYDKVLRIKFESDYLAHITYEGAKMRWTEIDDSTRERLDFELETIKTMGFPGYFLIVWDFLKAARDMGVSVGPGRGSAAGSAAAYSLRITEIDPIKYDLLFERFLNPDRISMPDIDIDFDDDGRAKVLKWVENKYGHNRVANIVTFGTMAAKSSIKDVARVQQLPLSESNRLADLVPDKPGTKLKDALKDVPELKAAYEDTSNEAVSSVLRYAETMEGTVRNTGVHACGIIICRDDLYEHIPVGTSKQSDLLVTQYDGKHVEDVGMLKMDFLGLKTLSIIKDALYNIKKSKGIDIDIENVPLEDAKTYELYQNGETTGLFQFESEGMKKHLKDLKPTRFEDLIAMNALYRPGPMEYIPDFVKRKHGLKKIIYDHPLMKESLEETYGITVYQEQVMLLSRVLGGFTRGDSDTLRKAMGKKQIEMMNKLKLKFREGCKANPKFMEGLSEAANPDPKNDKTVNPDKLVDKIWGDWEEFAKYAFNKSHATCYSYVSYQTAYIKAHYPAEFMAAVLSRNLNDIKKVSFFMDECKRMGMDVLGPDVNESDMRFTVNSNGQIRFGLNAVKGVGEAAVQNILDETAKNGAFDSVYDFVERIDLSSVNKRSFESLVYAGGFDSFKKDVERYQYFGRNKPDITFMEELIRYGNKMKLDANSGPTLFGNISETVEVEKPQPPVCEPWSVLERLNYEKELVGIYLSEHPLDIYGFEVKHFVRNNLSDLNEMDPLKDKDVSVAGFVIAAEERHTKSAGKPFGTMTLEDKTGSFQLAMFGKAYQEFRQYFCKDWALLLRGRVQQHPFRDDQLEFKVKSITQLQFVREQVLKSITLKIDIAHLDDKFANLLLKNIKDDIIDKESPAVAGKGPAVKQGKTEIRLLFYDRSGAKPVTVTMFSRTVRVHLKNELLNFIENNPYIEYSLN